MLDERTKKVILLLVLGWFLGYIHHFLIFSTQFSRLQGETQVLAAQLEELKAVPPIKVKVKTTAYSNDSFSINVKQWQDGRTATNKVARRGLVAADWGVFPPGTKIYIPGYGEGVVEDRGGKVKGYHLDLFVDSRDEALQWGVRNMDVYVLELGGTLSKEVKVASDSSKASAQNRLVKASF